MKALKNAGQEEVPSAWKVDLVIYPDLFLENNTFDELSRGLGDVYKRQI